MNRPIRLDYLDILSDDRLVRQLDALRGKERKVLAAVLRHLTEMERRRLYLPRGYSSLFEFCTQHLKYSRSAAGRRIASARTLARSPSLEGYLLSGEINLYSLSLVSGILTEENFERVVSGIRNRSTRDVEALVAAFRPGRVLKDRVRQVCVMVPSAPATQNTDPYRASHRPGPGSLPDTGRIASSPRLAGVDSAPGARCGAGTPGAGSERPSGPSAARPGNDAFEHVTIRRKYKFEFAVDSEFMKKFDRMKALLSGRFPGGISFETLFMLLMDEYIERHSPEGRAARRRKRLTARAGRDTVSGREGRSDHDDPVHRSGSAAGDTSGGSDSTGDGTGPGAVTGRARKDTRSIPGKVRDEVYLRDGGRCTFKGSDGKRCGSKWNLQIDHIVPFALGGDNSPGNLRLLCGKHNRLEAERAFGRRHMERFKKKE
jgi:hypothetical protein